MAASRWRTGAWTKEVVRAAQLTVRGAVAPAARRAAGALRADASRGIFAGSPPPPTRWRAPSQLSDMSAHARIGFALVVSVAMLALGVLVAARPLWSGGRPLTQSWWLDGAFALFFLVRGAYGIRLARRQSQLATRAD